MGLKGNSEPGVNTIWQEMERVASFAAGCNSHVSWKTGPDLCPTTRNWIWEVIHWKALSEKLLPELNRLRSVLKYQLRHGVRYIRVDWFGACFARLAIDSIRVVKPGVRQRRAGDVTTSAAPDNRTLNLLEQEHNL